MGDQRTANARFVTERRPLPLSVFAVWPDAPYAYLHFTPIHYQAAERAQQAGWLYRGWPESVGHFHMLVAPMAVTQVLRKFVGALGR